MTVEDALRKIRNQAAMLSWLMQVSNDEEPAREAIDGVSDTCDDMVRLARRLARTLDAETLNRKL